MNSIGLMLAATITKVSATIARLFIWSRDEILLISCQSDGPTRDILDLAEAIRSIQYNQYIRQVKVLAGRMDRNISGAFTFMGKLLSMLKLAAAARIIVLDAYCPAVCIPKKRKGQIVVQLWHAPEAIKKFSLQITDTPAGYSSMTTKTLKMHRNYDYILCPAEATRPFFAEAFGYPEDVFIKYGLPELDRIGMMKVPAVGDRESPARIKARMSIHEQYPELPETFTNSQNVKPLTIVYAPTFRDGASVDTVGLVNALEKALPGLIIVLKLHPLDLVRNKASIRETERRSDPEDPHISIEEDNVLIKDESCVIADSTIPLIEWYADADIVITDYSGVAVTAAAAGIASYYYIYDIDEYKEKRGLNVDLREEAIGKYAFIDADKLAEQIASDFTDENKPDYDYSALKSFADKYLEVPLAGNTQRLAEFITSL